MKVIVENTPTKQAMQKAKRKFKGLKARAVVFRAKTDPDALEPYDWGPKGEPKGQSIAFIPGKGWKIG